MPDRIAVTAKFKPEVLRKIERLVRTEGSDRIAWINDAAIERLARVEDGKDTGLAKILSLTPEEKNLVLMLADCLAATRGKETFRAAVHGVLAWLLESVEATRTRRNRKK